MNERIRKLAEQAGYKKDMFGVGHWDMPECKRFAELIVLDCLDIIDAEVPGMVGVNAMEKVAKHFGVE